MIDIPIKKYNRNFPCDNSNFGAVIDTTHLDSFNSIATFKKAKKEYRKISVINEKTIDRNSKALVLEKNFNVFTTTELFCLKKAIIHMPSGAVINSDGMLIQESLWGAALHGFPAFRNDRSTKWKWLFQTDCPVDQSMKDLSISYCYNRSYFQFYHFFMDCLSRYYVLDKMLDKLSDLKILIGNFRKGSFQTEALRLVGLNQNQILTTDDFSNELTHFSTVYFPLPVFKENLGLKPSYKSGLHYKYLDISYFDWLRQKFFLGIKNESIIPRACLYLKRGKGFGRSVNQEEELINRLKIYGIVAIDPGSMPFKVQLQYFLDAALIIAPHGAALTHLAWTPCGCTVLELIASNYDDPSYRVICAEKKHDHRLFLGQPDDAKDDRSNYNIDVEEIICFIKNYILTHSV